MGIKDLPDHYDPEGFLGSLNSTFLTFLGLIVGDFFIVQKQKWNRVITLTTSSVLFFVIGLAFTSFKFDDGWIPVNKNLWSVSFVLFMAGMANAVLMIMYVLEIYNVWVGWPFGYLGANSILVYCGHEILSGIFPFGWGTSGRHFETLFSNLLGV